MKTDYLEGIATVKQFLNDIDLLSENKVVDINLSFYKKNYEKLLFYISKSFLSDNYDQLFYNLDPEVADAVFNNKTFLNPEIKKYHSISLYLNERKYCKMPERFHNDPMNAYKVIVRNALCHYNYKLKDDRVIIDKVNFEEGAEISIASIICLVRDTLSSYGMSTKKGAYDYCCLLSPIENQSKMILIKNLKDNEQAPSLIIKNLNYQLKKQGLKQIRISPKKLMIFLKQFVAQFGDYYVKVLSFKPDIMRKANLFKISNRKELDLYMCAHDDIKRAGIAYNILLNLIFKLRDGKTESLSHLTDFYPILSNTIFISYMSLVFDDLFTKKFAGNINSKLFIQKTEIEDKDIPRKLRNSLAHSRYRFEDIFDSSKDIVIEFWDEKDGIKNFECKITKENALTLINDYLVQLSS